MAPKTSKGKGRMTHAEKKKQFEDMEEMKDFSLEAEEESKTAAEAARQEKGKGKMTAAERKIKYEEMQEMEDRLEAEEEAKTAAETSKAAKDRQEKARKAAECKKSFQPVTTKAEYSRSATHSATRAEYPISAMQSATNAANTWLLKHKAPTSSEDKAQPKCPKSSIIVPMPKHYPPVYVTDQQHAQQWADWCSNLPEGIPELYKLHKRLEEEQVRKEDREAEKKAREAEKKKSREEDGHEADDEEDT